MPRFILKFIEDGDDTAFSKRDDAQGKTFIVFNDALHDARKAFGLLDLDILTKYHLDANLMRDVSSHAGRKDIVSGLKERGLNPQYVLTTASPFMHESEFGSYYTETVMPIEKLLDESLSRFPFESSKYFDAQQEFTKNVAFRESVKKEQEATPAEISNQAKTPLYQYYLAHHPDLQKLDEDDFVLVIHADDKDDELERARVVDEQIVGKSQKQLSTVKVTNLLARPIPQTKEQFMEQILDNIWNCRALDTLKQQQFIEMRHQSSPEGKQFIDAYLMKKTATPKQTQLNLFLEKNIDEIDKALPNKLKLPAEKTYGASLINLLATSTKKTSQDLCNYIKELSTNKTEISQDQVNALKQKFEGAIEEAAKKQIGATSSKMMTIIHAAYKELNKDPLSLQISEKHRTLMEKHSEISNIKDRLKAIFNIGRSKDEEVDLPDNPHL